MDHRQLLRVVSKSSAAINNPSIRRSRMRRLMLETLEDRRVFNVDWRNPIDSVDVNSDGNVTPLDALVIINYINAGRPGTLPNVRNPVEPFFDVTGNQNVSPLDALLVINHLNTNTGSSRILAESANQFARETSVTITLGQTSGTRVYRVQIDSQFDTSDQTPALEDLLAVYLVDPNNPHTTLLDRGASGTALFTMTRDEVELVPGRVRWDGSILDIDMSDLPQFDTGLLKFQLLNNDSDSQTKITVRPLSNSIDLAGTTTPALLPDALPLTHGASLALSNLSLLTEAKVQVENVRYDVTTGKVNAEIRLRNDGESVGRDVAVVFTGLPSGVSLQSASGTTTNGAPYINLRPAISSGGLAQGAWSEALAIEFNNPANVPLAIKPQVLAATNHAPTLAPIAALTVMPGGVLKVPLAAHDSDGDTLSFSMVPSDGTVALPTGSIEPSGILTFRPSPNQLGAYQFDVIVSDGTLEAIRTVTLNVIADPLSTTRVSGTILKVNGQPLVGMPVQIGAVQGLTQSDGSFTLDLGSGQVVSDTLKVRGELINGPVVYPFIAEKLAFILEHEVFAQVNNVIDRPIYLPEIDVANGQTIDPMRSTTVTSAALPGAKVEVAASTLMNQQGTPFTGVLSVTEVPVSLTPAALPDGLMADLVVTIQPGEMVFTAPTPLSLPNRGGYAPGTLMDLWSINPVTGQFDKVGVGQVSADGSVIDTISGGIRNSSWHFFDPPAPTGPKVKNDPRNKKPNGCGANAAATSSCELHSGALIETHELVTYHSQGQDRGLTLTYDSLRADPRPIVHFTFDDLNPNLYSVPSAVRLIAELEVSRNGTSMTVPGFKGDAYGLNGDENIWRLPDEAGTVDAALQVDLRNQPSGVYDYTLRSGMLGYAGARGFIGTLNESTGQFTSVNTRKSPFGAGWGIEGLLELVEGRDGTVLVVDGDGSEVLYTQKANGEYDRPAGEFAVLRKSLDGTFRRTWPDQTIEKYDSNNRLISIEDRNGNLSRYQYDSVGRLIKFTDPVGLETTISYSSAVIEITDPASRVTRLNLDAQGNLIRITDPDGASRQWRYDSQHHMTGEIDQLGNSESAIYGFHGRVTEVVRKDGSTRAYAPIDVQGLFRPEQTAADPIATPLLNPKAGRVPLPESIFTDVNGNVTRSRLDDRGQVVSASDSVGALPGVVRNADNLPVRVTDANGHSTWFTYDEKGNVVSKSVDLNAGRTTFGSALRFDGVNDHVQVNDAPALRPVNVTLESWVNFDSIPSIAIIAGKTVGSSTHDSYNIWYQEGHLRAFVSDGNQFNVILMPWKPELGRWYHVAYTFDDAANTQVLYIDGTPVVTGEATVSIAYDSHPFLIGREIDDERLQYSFPGSIDDVRLWGIARSAEEIRRGLLHPLNGDEAGLIAYYTFDDDSADEVLDSSQNKLHGILSADGPAYVSPSLPDVRPVQAPSDLSSWWSGDGYANDLSASNNGTLRNGAGFTPGVDGLAFAFDGQNDVITVADASDGSLDITEDLTINAWIHPTVIAGDQRTIVQKRPANGNNDVAYGLFLEADGRLAFTSRQNAAEFRVVYSDATIPLNTWSHVAVTVGDGTVQFFIDGVRNAVRQYPFLRSGTNGPLTIGSTLVDSAIFHPFQGGIDEVQLIHRALTATEIMSISSADHAGQIKPMVYDATSDFSLKSNSNGVWAYGYSTTADPMFKPASQKVDDGTILSWRETPSGPFVVRPRNRVTQGYYSLHSPPPPPDVMNLDPSFDGRNAVVQWTAPAAGTYRVNGRFEGIDNVSTDVTVLLNDNAASPLVSGNLNGLGSQKAFGFSRTVAAGDRLQFTVNPRGNSFFDGTGLSVTIIPEGLAQGDGTIGTGPTVATTTTTYDPFFNQVTRVVDELGRVTQSTIDPANGNILAITRVVGNVGGNDDAVSQFTYTSSGQIETVTDALGRVTKNTYDSIGRLTKIQRALGTPSETSQQFQYDAAGRVVAIIDENGHSTQFAYDAMNRLRTTTYADGSVSSISYDARGNIVSATDALGHVERQTFDSLDRRTRHTDAGENLTVFRYDRAGNLISTTDALNHSVRNTYDARNRLVTTTDVAGGVTRYKYDAKDQLTSVLDASGNQTSYLYDARGKVTGVVDPLGEITYFRYDVAQQLTEQIDRLGRTIQFTYNDLAQLTTEKWLNSDQSQANLIQYSRDAIGQLLQANDNFSSVAFSRDALNRVLTEQTAGPNGIPTSLLSTTYDAVGNVLTQSDTINGVVGATVTSTFDSRNRVTQLIQSGAGIGNKRVSITYNAIGQTTSLSRFADTAGQLPVAATTTTYDTLNRVTGITHRNAVSAILNSFLFQYDSVDRITRITDIDGITSYTYDTRDQLTSASHADASNPDESYAYDVSGNRTSSHAHGSSYRTGQAGSTSPDANRLTSDGKFNYFYDANGNLSKRVDIVSGSVREFTFDHRNRLILVTDRAAANGPAIQSIRTTYDLQNRRIATNVDTTPADATDGQTIFFVYADQDIIAELTDGDGSGPASAVVSMRYLHGPAVDQVLAQESASGVVHWMLSDHSGTIADLISNSGVVENHIKYDSYGNVISQSNAAASTRYRYTGREFDAETGLLYNRARMYDAAIGRFISEDPLGLAGGDANVYRYVSNSPLTATDPLGLFEWPNIPFFSDYVKKRGYDGVDLDRADGDSPQPERPKHANGRELLREFDRELERLKKERDETQKLLDFLKDHVDDEGFITRHARPKKPKKCDPPR